MLGARVRGDEPRRGIVIGGVPRHRDGRRAVIDRERDTDSADHAVRRSVAHDRDGRMEDGRGDRGPDPLAVLRSGVEYARPALAVASRGERADRRAYRSAARILQHALAAAQAVGEVDAFGEYLERLRERHRRRPTLIAILDKANL
jgi:hypothetical protein